MTHHLALVVHIEAIFSELWVTTQSCYGGITGCQNNQACFLEWICIVFLAKRSHCEPNLNPSVLLVEGHSVCMCAYMSTWVPLYGQLFLPK